MKMKISSIGSTFDACTSHMKLGEMSSRNCTYILSLGYHINVPVESVSFSSGFPADIPNIKKNPCYLIITEVSLSLVLNNHPSTINIPPPTLTEVTTITISL